MSNRNLYNFINNNNYEYGVRATYNTNIIQPYIYINNYIIPENNNLLTNWEYININIPTTPTLRFTSHPKYIGTQCSICWENVENIETMSVTNCNIIPHVFHKSCIQTWTLQSSTCPNCRSHL